MKNIIWLPAYIPQQEPLERLDEELDSLIMYITPTAMEEEIRRKIIQKYKAVINERFPNYKVQVFGSCCNSLYLPNSDIDLVIINSEEQEVIPAQRMSSILSKLTRKLHPHTSYIYLVKKAKIPIIKIIDYSSDVAIDVSYNTAENTTMVAEFVAEKLMEYSDIKWMVLFLKQYLANRELNNNANGGLGGFAVFLLVLSFLELYPTLYKDTKLDFYTKPNSKAKLLIDFFHFYGRILDINSVGLAPTGMEGDRSVIMIDKDYYYDVIEPYETKQANMGYARPKMLLLDPTNQANNTAKGCSLIETVFSEFNKSYDRILTIASNDDMQFENGTYIGFLCNDIITISPEEVSKRRQFKQYGVRLGLSQWDGHLHLQDDFWSDKNGTKHKLETKSIAPSIKRVNEYNHYNDSNKFQKLNSPNGRNPSTGKPSPPKQLKKPMNQKPNFNQKSPNPKSFKNIQHPNIPNRHPKFSLPNQSVNASKLKNGPKNPQSQKDGKSYKNPNNQQKQKNAAFHGNDTSSKQQKNTKKNNNPNIPAKLFALKSPTNKAGPSNKQSLQKKKGKNNSPNNQGQASQLVNTNLRKMNSSPNKIKKNKQ
ncbi:hypothetical protein HDV06_002628 [Boothiomyces sp. JEL0866]|nr:hypothetical protein HDV06_002628 [Boothiomyces sp. JEL0866]